MSTRECSTISVRGLILSENRLLVEYFAPRAISFLPGGQVEADEDLRDTLDRELREELTNCEFEIGEYLGQIACFWEVNNRPDSCLNHYFEVKLLPTVPLELIEAGEAGRIVKWIDVDSTEMACLKPATLTGLIHSRLQGVTSPWNHVDREVRQR